MFDSIKFEHAIIEFDALGQSEPPQSNFLGIAFHATYDVTHDAVQYVSHPEYPWFDLRREMAEGYEKPVTPAPNGDMWFHAKIEIRDPEISVFVDGSEVASLVVNELTPRQEKGFGLWCGPGVGGYFSNLNVTIIK